MFLRTTFVLVLKVMERLAQPKNSFNIWTKVHLTFILWVVDLYVFHIIIIHYVVCLGVEWDNISLLS